MRQGEGGRFVGVGVVDGDVEGLVTDLPEESAGCLYCQYIFRSIYVQIWVKRRSPAILGSTCLL